MEEKILVVDDDSFINKAISHILEQEGYIVDSCYDGEKAIQSLHEDAYDIVIVDIKLPNINGVEVLREALTLYPEIVVIMITGFATVDSAVETLKMGAFDYISKPFNAMELSIIVKKALEQKRLKTENRQLREELEKKYRFDNIIGNSMKMQEVYSLVRKVAKGNSTVVIYGESGTGKELIAKAIHYNSDRKDKQLISVNCGAIPENLLEDELFGHVKGAFTDAIRSKLGRFELAHKGTLFLDEIGNMSPNLQVKLLRVLQEREFERVGGTETMKVDVRIVAATSTDLEKYVKEKKFREDLYYRINVIPINLPALRERRDDIPLLIQHFLQKFCKEQNAPLKTIAQKAMRLLMSYTWSGNVRQLENVIERIVTLVGTRRQILPSDLPPEIQDSKENNIFSGLEIPDEGIEYKSVINSMEISLILKTLRKTNWNKKQAARLLNLKRTTLVEKIKKMNINPEMAVEGKYI
ncbi:MAG: Fis family transcriptional regulator [Candidatus Schekmanbacteria bacterium RBG_13_48_7]|uniref:Fis family transcriptional regulator n=1 Tax=Candidatus Schekmanbacteria bacterium RBG_13_48_7 TaxID=1817878 RepID=A0A1F7RI28_9BACT|nr:MAG: Fis family transcriptional regulator [Candidatus Schekmanbacteria bacterium RBG_13_48_7]